MEMIEEIKKALAKAENTQAYYESKKTHDWLQYLIGEVERLDKERRYQGAQTTEAMKRGGILEREARELRKALEDIADYQHRWSDSPITEVQNIARKALEDTRT